MITGPRLAEKERVSKASKIVDKDLTKYDERLMLVCFVWYLG